MRYLWDTDKARTNEEKHSVTFREAADLLGTNCLKVPVASKGEKRYMAIGRIRGEYLSIIYTDRRGAQRIISARHSTKKERNAYERYYN